METELLNGLASRFYGLIIVIDRIGYDENSLLSILWIDDAKKNSNFMYHVVSNR